MLWRLREESSPWPAATKGNGGSARPAIETGHTVVGRPTADEIVVLGGADGLARLRVVKALEVAIGDEVLSLGRSAQQRSGGEDQFDRCMNFSWY